MNKYFKEFLRRGLMFSGFGPIILGIVYLCVSYSVEDFSLSAREILLAIISTYLLAFVQAGASVFNQIEHWVLPKSMFLHFSFIYVAYVVCYLINSWIPFELMVIAIFTAVFVVIYFAVWLIVFLSIKITSKKLNTKFFA
ncbi:MAG: DUF3021 domain-containing protein [Ruminococcus sp.]|nr:DUF3021 domain-containing protein [Ruminococcus sp.]